MKIILEGITGSKAYGLDTPDSDTDLKGVFVYPTEEILSIYPKQQTINQHEPDIEYHEVLKFVSLAAKCNPTILEMLFLNDYTELTLEGRMLIEIREAFLNKTIYDSYGGYARTQAMKMYRKAQLGEEYTRYSKHTRHTYRLLQQGRQLLESGTLQVRVDNRDELFAISEMPVDKMIDKFEKDYTEFMKIGTCLPDEPDYEKINDVLLKIRRMNYGM